MNEWIGMMLEGLCDERSIHPSLPPSLPPLLTIEDGTSSQPGLSMLISICRSELILIVFSSI